MMRNELCNRIGGLWRTVEFDQATKRPDGRSSTVPHARKEAIRRQAPPPHEFCETRRAADQFMRCSKRVSVYCK